MLNKRPTVESVGSLVSRLIFAGMYEGSGSGKLEEEGKVR
jgi:hypothetical protein